MIVESLGTIWSRNNNTLETGIPKVCVTTTESSKKVFGVIASLEGSFEGMKAYSQQSEDETHIDVNSLGEGMVWVTNKNGEVQNGDYIVSSAITGLGQKQDDDVLRSSTVAKCTQDIDWNSVVDTVDYDGKTYKKYLTICTYHCG